MSGVGGYRAALLDWLACASAGRASAVARAAADTGDRLLAAAAAGHVLDFDDTWTPGLAHLSAATAPAALFSVAGRGGSCAEVVEAHAAGFETMAVLARHGHPAIYERGLHPTAACGGAGAAAGWVVGADLPAGALPSALAIALTRSGGLLASFGGDGKSLGVAGAVVAGRDAARLAAAGAGTDLGAILAGICRSWGVDPLEPAALLEPDTSGDGAIAANWIKAYPCCLQTHSAIEAASTVDATRTRAGRLRIRVHPVSLEAASVTRPRTGMEAKFSIPYLVAWALIRGRPDVAAFDAVDPEVLAASEALLVEADPGLGQSEAVIDREGSELARVIEALGSPSRPMSPAELEAKVRSLAGPELVGALDDPGRPAAEILGLAGLGPAAP